MQVIKLLAKTIMKSQSHRYQNESYFMKLKIRHTQKRRDMGQQPQNTAAQ